MVRLVPDKVYSCLRSWPRLRLLLPSPALLAAGGHRFWNCGGGRFFDHRHERFEAVQAGPACFAYKKVYFNPADCRFVQTPE
jgi:hypothetical protein